MPSLVMSVLPFTASKSTATTANATNRADRKQTDGMVDSKRIIKRVRRDFSVSYAHLLDLEPPQYDPYFFDDNSIRSRSNMVTYKLEGMVESVIPFIRKKTLKNALNEEFRTRHPWLNKNMTLSKIRKIKQDIFQVGTTADLELSTTACAYVYFERLCLLNEVFKHNRKLMASVCLLLAYKFNEPLNIANPDKVKHGYFFSQLHDVLRTKKSDVLKHEFQVYVTLQMDLVVSLSDITRHLDVEE
jgi:hypothetical protein